MLVPEVQVRYWINLISNSNECFKLTFILIPSFASTTRRLGLTELCSPATQNILKHYLTEKWWKAKRIALRSQIFNLIQFEPWLSLCTRARSLKALAPPTLSALLLPNAITLFSLSKAAGMFQVDVWKDICDRLLCDLVTKSSANFFTPR